jgi:starvation-inducible DNA-binding protein
MKKDIVKFSLFESSEDIGINKEENDKVVDFLKKLQSNSFVLFMKLWNFHWNIVSKRFGQTHKFFNKLYDSFFDRIDDIAERIRELDKRPLGTLKNILDETDIKEYSDDDDVPSESRMFKMIVEDYETIIKSIRKCLEDEKVDSGTTNYLEDLISKLEKELWMLKSHIED